jgi:two-component system, NtrC family, response regulator PilR
MMRVLVVEDHEDTRCVLERFLTRCGYDVAAAGDLRSGLSFLRSQPFDAIVSDIALPDGTGYALVSEARRCGIGALAIALSAYSYPRDVEEAKVTGFDYHLKKPLDCIKLRSLLQHQDNRSDMPEVETKPSRYPSDTSDSYRRFDL